MTETGNPQPLPQLNISVRKIIDWQPTPRSAAALVMQAASKCKNDFTIGAKFGLHGRIWEIPNDLQPCLNSLRVKIFFAIYLVRLSFFANYFHTSLV